MYRMYLSIILYKFKMAAKCANSFLFVLSTLSRPDVAGGKVSPRGEYKPLLFWHCLTTQGPESTCCSGNCRCFTEIWPKMYMTYVWFWFDFDKSSALHIFAHWVVKYQAISIYLISIKHYWYRLSHGCEICCVRSCTRELSRDMHKRALSLYFNR